MRDGDRGEVGREDGGAAICVDPEKGATAALCARPARGGISIHAPAKGATYSKQIFCIITQYSFSQFSSLYFHPYNSYYNTVCNVMDFPAFR